MTQGIRAYCDNRFAFYLPQLTELGGAGFRAKVMDSVVRKFDISVASAATHYNHSLKMARLNEPASVDGLGRPEDKKGGRPVLNPVTVVKVKTGEVVVDGVSRGAAQILIAKAAMKKTAPKLAIKQDLEVAAETAAETVTA